MNSGGLLLPLGEGMLPAQVGGKCRGLAQLIAAGLPVPESWVLPAAMLDRQLQRLQVSTLAGQVEAALHGGDWRTPARELRGAILQGELAEDAAAETAALLDRAGKLAVRSSATCEGVPGASFAGQFQSFLDIEDVKQASAAISSCWASLWSETALRYRLSARQHEAPGMAVLLQEFVAGSVSGTAMADDGGVHIEAAWGLGASIMSGLVVPDRWSFGPEGKLAGLAPGCKTVRAIAAGGNLTWQPVTPQEQASACLSESQAVRVAGLGLRAAAGTGRPVELEWVLDGDDVWLVQARLSGAEQRPDTSLRSQPKASFLQGIPAAPGRVAGRVRVVHSLADLLRAGPQEIVVSRYASAELAGAFRAAAWITEMGGGSGHAVTIARERHLPMVTGVLGATQRLSDGQPVRIDGLQGTLELVSDE